MREWREATVERIRELRPRRILEIGVGSGLLLSKLAPDAEAYWATDFAAPVIRKLTEGVRSDPELAAKVELRCQAAEVTDGLPTGFFDTVVINSVIQYFPSLDHLHQVIRGALDLLAPGGALFLGDVRDLRQARVFQSAIQAARADADTGPDSLRRAVERGLALEKELLVDPDWFTTLGVGVDLRTKAGRHHNELTRYRYDVVLYEGAPALSLDGVPGLDWTGRDALLARLDGTGPLRVRGVPDARTAGDLAGLRALDTGSTDGRRRHGRGTGGPAGDGRGTRLPAPHHLVRRTRALRRRVRPQRRGRAHGLPVPAARRPRRRRPVREHPGRRTRPHLAHQTAP